jgi:hypothetical protein
MRLAIFPKVIQKTLKTATCYTHATSGFIESCVFRTIGVAAWTICLSKIRRQKSIASQNVLTVGNSFQVCWINAAADSAEVVRNQRAEFANEQAVSDVMGGTALVDIPKAGVSIFIRRSRPQPAWCSVKSYFRVYANLFKEASEKFAANGKSVRIVMGHRDLLKVNDGLGDVRLQSCAAFSL